MANIEDLPYSFKAGAIANSSEVNANFNAVMTNLNNVNNDISEKFDDSATRLDDMLEETFGVNYASEVETIKESLSSTETYSLINWIKEKCTNLSDAEDSAVSALANNYCGINVIKSDELEADDTDIALGEGYNAITNRGTSTSTVTLSREYSDSSSIKNKHYVIQEHSIFENVSVTYNQTFTYTSNTVTPTSSEIGKGKKYSASGIKADTTYYIYTDTEGTKYISETSLSTTDTATVFYEEDADGKYTIDAQTVYFDTTKSKETSFVATAKDEKQGKVLFREIYGRIPSSIRNNYAKGVTKLNFTIGLPSDFYSELNSIYEVNVYAIQKYADWEVSGDNYTLKVNDTTGSAITKSIYKLGTITYTTKLVKQEDITGGNAILDTTKLTGSITLAKGYNLFDLYFSCKGGIMDTTA